MTWVTSIRFGWGALRAAWHNRPRSLFAVLLAIALENASAIATPLILGIGLQQALTNPEGTVVAMVIAAYTAALFLASAGSHLAHTLYGRIEQSVQSEWMADGLASSLGSHPEARAAKDTSEVSYALDALGGCLRDALSSMVRSILPSTVRVVAGAAAIAAVAGLGPVIVYLLGIAVYLWLSSPLAAVHQKRQSEFFGACLTNFGSLSNAAGMWRESRLFGASPFLAQRYRAPRLPVEDLGVASYRATRNLVLTQTGLVSLIIGAVLALHRASAGADAEALGSIVSLAGVTLAAVNPLQTVGFALSMLAAAVATHEESMKTVRPAAPEGSAALTELAVRSVNEGDPRPAAEPGAVLTVSGLGVPALPDGTSLGAGRPIWVLGPSGSGKTTLLEQIIGLRSSGGAQLTVSTPHSDSSPDAATAIAYLPQESRLLETTAAENVDFGRGLAPTSAAAGLDALGLAPLPPAAAGQKRSSAETHPCSPAVRHDASASPEHSRVRNRWWFWTSRRRGSTPQRESRRGLPSKLAPRRQWCS